MRWADNSIISAVSLTVMTWIRHRYIDAVAAFAGLSDHRRRRAHINRRHLDRLGTRCSTGRLLLTCELYP